MLRAFALFFQLVNIAEQHHRIRRRREYEAEGRVPRESLADAFAQLATPASRPEAAPAAAERDCGSSSCSPRIPTEATRRTVLEAHRRVAALLARLDDEGAPPSERHRVEERLAEEITLLWQTDEIRSKRPRVVDEIRQGLWFFEQSFWNAIPNLERASRASELGERRRALRFGTWIGGDLDGNPNVGPETIEDALERARQLARTSTAEELRELGAAWGMSTTVIGEVPELGDVDEPFRAALVGSGTGSATTPTPTGRRCSPISTSSTCCSARIAATGSPTAGSPTSARARARSASTSRSSTSASMPPRSAHPTTGSAPRSRRQREARHGTGRAPSTG